MLGTLSLKTDVNVPPVRSKQKKPLEKNSVFVGATAKKSKIGSGAG
jgi:hypothetical protein